ncbi:hypothetical protein F5884DRAFT_748926 [Xylogone sp. PMI_703]|nr:hypothetical protein F5884DRAFT_748926 [Xylogone sp. PMI_703]
MNNLCQLRDHQTFSSIYTEPETHPEPKIRQERNSFSVSSSCNIAQSLTESSLSRPDTPGIAGSDTKSVGTHSGIHPYSPSGDSHIRFDINFDVVQYKDGWSFLFFQNSQNFIQCVLVPPEATRKPTTTPIIIENALEGAEGTPIKALRFRSGVLVIFAKEKQGRHILVDAYFETAQHHTNLTNPLTALLELLPTTQAHHTYLNLRWGCLEAQNIEISTSSEIALLYDLNYRYFHWGFTICVELCSGRTGYYSRDQSLSLWDAKIHTDILPYPWLGDNSQAVRHRIWSKARFNGEGGASVLILRKDSDSCSLVYTLVTFPDLTTQVSAPFWFDSKDCPVTFDQISWESIYLNYDNIDVKDFIDMFFSTHNGELYHSRLVFKEGNYEYPVHQRGVQLLAPIGSVKSGTKLSFVVSHGYEGTGKDLLYHER